MHRNWDLNLIIYSFPLATISLELNLHVFSSLCSISLLSTGASAEKSAAGIKSLKASKPCFATAVVERWFREKPLTVGFSTEVVLLYGYSSWLLLLLSSSLSSGSFPVRCLLACKQHTRSNVPIRNRTTFFRFVRFSRFSGCTRSQNVCSCNIIFLFYFMIGR